MDADMICISTGDCYVSQDFRLDDRGDVGEALLTPNTQQQVKDQC